jgi:hypothetical protein
MSTQHLNFIHVYKEFAMARFVQPHLATPHSATFSGRPAAPNREISAESSRTLAAMLMAAVLAALMVVADQLIDTWVDGHLMLAWVLMWSVAFAALAVLAVPLRHLASHAAHAIHSWWAEYQRAQNEEAMWEYAKRDPRVMAELQAARSRQFAD